MPMTGIYETTNVSVLGDISANHASIVNNLSGFSEQLLLGYSGGINTSFVVNAAGQLTITPTGSNIILGKALNISNNNLTLSSDLNYINIANGVRIQNTLDLDNFYTRSAFTSNAVWDGSSNQWNVASNGGGDTHAILFTNGGGIALIANGSIVQGSSYSDTTYKSGVALFINGSDKNIAIGKGYAGSNNWNAAARKLEILDNTNPQLRLTHTNSTVYSEFQTDANGNLKWNSNNVNGYIYPSTATQRLGDNDAPWYEVGAKYLSSYFSSSVYSSLITESTGDMKFVSSNTNGALYPYSSNYNFGLSSNRWAVLYSGRLNLDRASNDHITLTRGGTNTALIYLDSSGDLNVSGTGTTNALTIASSGGLRINNGGNVALLQVSAANTFSSIGNIYPSSDNTYSLGSGSFRWANGYLVNLSSVNVISNLIPSTTNNFDLGSSSSKWRDIYIHSSKYHYNNINYWTESVDSSGSLTLTPITGDGHVFGTMIMLSSDAAAVSSATIIIPTWRFTTASATPTTLEAIVFPFNWELVALQIYTSFTINTPGNLYTRVESALAPGSDSPLYIIGTMPATSGVTSFYPPVGAYTYSANTLYEIVGLHGSSTYSYFINIIVRLKP